MLGPIAIIPSTPVLVPELVGAAAAEVAELRAAVIAAAALLPQRWVVVGRGDSDGVIDPDCIGTFAGFGVDMPVRLAPGAAQSEATPVDLPLCALIAGWVRGQAQPEAVAHVRVYSDQHGAAAARTSGRQLRAEIGQLSQPTGVVVIADGVNTLKLGAPGGYRPDDAGVQVALDDALACGDAAALTRLPGQVTGRVAYQVLAGLAEPAPRSAKELYRGAPYGVGYFAGIWQL